MRNTAASGTCGWCGTSVEPGDLLCSEGRACDHFVDSVKQTEWRARLDDVYERLEAMDPIALQAWFGVEWPYVHEIGHAKHGCPTREIIDHQMARVGFS
jgi:hypothetical protein